jgi:LTXXQ motif family protein
MVRIPVTAATFLMTITAPAVSQHVHGPSPYVDLVGREIKSLGPEETNQLLAGEGMGLALAGELNGYPGPLHVLEHSTALELTPGQVEQIQTIRDTMLAEARRLGAEIVELERGMDGAFRSRAIDDAELQRYTEEIATRQGRLRYVHLRAHLQLTRLLSEEQLRRYDTLRGYR